MTVCSAMSMSLDGFVTGPNVSREHPLGVGGDPLHEWIVSGTEQDEELLTWMARGAGAVVMGRRSYDQCEGDGGWGDGGPVAGVPCFVVTHQPPERVAAPDVFTFVTDGVESAIKQAEAVAAGKVVALHGATVPQQALQAGLLDEMFVHLVPILLGGGVRLFDLFDAAPVRLERTDVIASPLVTHLRFRVVR
ncbi:dihydrofolate reductase family protein [Flindersiella endophytica]